MVSGELTMRQQHSLFTHYPLDSEIQLGGETLTSPYHIYDGSILFMGGRASATAAARLLGDGQLTPILDDQGQALAALWICDFTEANLGPHHELQISIFASFQPQPAVHAHPFAIYRLLTLNPQAMMVCHGLWNNTERVVRYNREHLMLDAQLCTSAFDLDSTSGRWRFQFEDAERKLPLVSGDITLAKPQPSVFLEMAGQLGPGGLLKTMRAPFIYVPVVNTRSAHAADNRVARTYTKSDRQTIVKFDDASTLTIHDPAYQTLNFQPDFIQHNGGVRFVYLRPEAAQA